MNSSNVLSFLRFADNTAVFVQNDSIDSAIEILNTELADVALWFDSNKLTFNLNKTQMIMLSRKKDLIPQNEVILRNEVVQRENKTNSIPELATFQRYLKKNQSHAA